MHRPTAILSSALGCLVLALGAVRLLGRRRAPDDDDRRDDDLDAAADVELEEMLLDAEDLPEGFEPSGEVDDTITTFCANEDATAGLQASAREVIGFTRAEAGTSVIQLAFRFDDDGAMRFVEQASAILDRCSDVPGAGGLAFTYEPLTEGLDAADRRRRDSHVGRYGATSARGS